MRRNQLQIMADILRVCKTRTRKTNIVYATNLNFKTTSKYLNRLINEGLIVEVKVDEDIIYYEITEEGKKALMDFISLYERLIGPFS
jgi:predicted transcriptional regulator